MRENCDFLVVGGGILGLTAAYELLRRGCEDIIVLEKEKTLGAHASGRNSGVLHAGIYYAPDSLRAGHCARGNSIMRDFCRENGVEIDDCGKVIVADSEEKLEGLFALHETALKNGVEARLIDEKELSSIEPRAYTFEKAIHSPGTSVFDPIGVLRALRAKIEQSGKARILLGTAFAGKRNGRATVAGGRTIAYRKLLNVAGAHADVVARFWGVGLDYLAVPFIGTYRELAPRSLHLVRSNIYPVPDPKMPFLGVHFTKGIRGKVFVGPTAIPVLGRESYGFFEDLGTEAFRFLYRNALMFASDEGYRANAFSEARKYLGSHFYSEAKKLLPALRKNDLVACAKAGIRAQLVDWERKKLVTDYVIRETEDSVHVLNSISPAFTSSMSFAKHVADVLLGEESDGS